MVMKIIKGLDFMFPIRGIKFAFTWKVRIYMFIEIWVNRVDLRLKN